MTTHAFATYIIRNDSYLPGALLLGFALRQMETPADLVCLITQDVSASAAHALSVLYHRVIRIPALLLPACHDQRRPYLSQVLTRINALRLGADGDLGCGYRKVVLLDADLLPLRCFDHLFALPTPAAILNERPDYLKCNDQNLRYKADRRKLRYGRWVWHSVYRSLPHGNPIPCEITDRVRSDPSNYGVNSALMVLEPSMTEFREVMHELSRDPEIGALLEQFRWPDMQYLTLRWSGKWHNVDACFAGIGGYPALDVLFGTHFAGVKPWQIRNKSVATRFARFPDFQRWYGDFLGMMNRHPEFRDTPCLARLEKKAMVLYQDVYYDCG